MIQLLLIKGVAFFLGSLLGTSLAYLYFKSLIVKRALKTFIVRDELLHAALIVKTMLNDPENKLTPGCRREMAQFAHSALKLLDL